MNTISLKAFPLEIILLICNNLDTSGLNVLARTCNFMVSLIDPLLYQQAVKRDEYKSKFLYAVIYRQTNAVAKFLKAGVLMSAFEDYTLNVGFLRSGISGISVEKRHALKRDIHPLLAAAYFGNIDVIGLLLSQAHLDIDFQDKSGKTALHYAIEADHPDIIKLLLEQGARIQNCDGTRILRAPFVHAAVFGNKRAIELMFGKLKLQNQGNKVDLCGPKVIFSETVKSLREKACYEACKKGYFDIIDFLLCQGVDVNSSVEQYSLLFWATTGNYISIVKLLVKYGARMESERDSGVVTMVYRHGSWHHAIENDSHLDIVKYLLESGYNVSNGGIHACALWALAKYSGRKGHRCYATSRGQKEIMSLLLKYGFDPKKCRHGCFKITGETSLIVKMRGIRSLLDYVEEQELQK